MANTNGIPKGLLDKLSTKEAEKLAELVSSGLSAEEAAGDMGLDLKGLTADTNKNASKVSNVANAAINIGTGAAVGGLPGAAVAAAVEGTKAVSNAVKRDDEKRKKEKEGRADSTKAEGDQDKTLQNIGSGLGAAQTALGLISGESTEIPEFEAGKDVNKAADMLADAYEKGIDPAIVATGQRDIEARRRSMLYKNQGEGGSSGARYNKDVVANLLANKAGNDLTIQASREKYSRLGPAAKAIASKDDIRFRKDMARRDQAYKESDAAAGLIGSGIDNIVGSLMLGEQFKAENERKKYE